MSRVCFVVNELLGQNRCGGIGTTTTWRALVLASRGHDVTVLLTMDPIELDPAWAQRYAAAGVEILFADPVDHVWPRGIARGVRVHRTLQRGRHCDAIVFQDYLAPGWVAMTAKRAGVAYADTTLITSTHGPLEWVYEGRRDFQPSPGWLLVGLAEQLCVELADVVVTPGRAVVDWMEERGWQPAPAQVLPRLTERHLPNAPIACRDGGPRAQTIDELVFFGRFDESKGVGVLIDALALVDPALLRGITLTFLGRPSTHDEGSITEQLDPDVKESVARLSFITDLDQPQALEYLRGDGRVALIPSIADNAPNAVIECIEHGIPALVSAAPSVCEWIAVEDRPQVTFPPNAGGLAASLATLLEKRTPPLPPRLREDAVDPIAAWEALLAAGREHDATQSAIERSGGLVVRDGDIALDDTHTELMTAVARRTGADAVTCAVRFPSGERYYLGRGLDASVVYPLLGGPGTLWREDVVDDLGGFDPTVADVDQDAELLLRLAVRGGTIVAVPEVLASADREPATDPGYHAACQATYRGLLDARLARWPPYLSGQHAELIELTEQNAALRDEVDSLRGELEAAQTHIGHFLGLAVRASRQEARDSEPGSGS
jgi:glycosyltransferase involved in cell wall biosynthesis